MIEMVPEHSGLLAKSDFSDLTPLLIIIGISVISAIGKAVGKRSESEGGENPKNKLIQMAKRYKAMRENAQQRDVPKEGTPYARTINMANRRTGSLSEWDRRQLQKKQEVQQRQSQPNSPRYIPQKPKTPPIQPPREIPVAALVVPQAKPVRQPQVRPRIQQKRPPERAAQQTKKYGHPIPTASRVSRPVTTKKQAEPVFKKEIPAGKTPRSLLKQRSSLRTAIIMKEILDTPIALRDSW